MEGLKQMETEYLAKFDATGCRETTIVKDVHYASDEERQKYIDDGYVPISDEDYQHYIGNRSAGDNGTGYIRDPKTGKPVSAPPMPSSVPAVNAVDATVSSEIMDMAEMMLEMSKTMENIQTAGGDII